jgi:predicted  nucleic acid-binding Zn-ribbon protein
MGVLGLSIAHAQPTPSASSSASPARSGTAHSQLQAAEAAFARAVLEHRAAKAVFDAAAAERDAARRSASEARSRIEAAYAERVSVAEREVAEAQAVFEAALAMPAVSDPEVAAAKALDDARRELSATNGQVRTLEAELSAVNRAAAATIARIGSLQSRLDELQATIASLSRQDAMTAAEVTPDMLRVAQEEDAQLAAIFDEFHPAMEAARRTARINIGMHLPTIFRTKGRLDGMAALAFCREKREHLLAYVKLSTEGIEQFQTLRGDAANLVAFALMTVADESLTKYRTANCTSAEHVARATTAMRSTRLADARKEAEQVE